MSIFHFVQVNRIKISTDTDPLAFAQKLLEGTDKAVTLSLHRPALPSTPHSNFYPLTPGVANTPISPLPGGLAAAFAGNPLEHEIDRIRKISSGALMPNVDGFPLSLPARYPPNYKYPSVSDSCASSCTLMAGILIRKNLGFPGHLMAILDMSMVWLHECGSCHTNPTNLP